MSEHLNYNQGSVLGSLEASAIHKLGSRFGRWFAGSAWISQDVPGGTQELSGSVQETQKDPKELPRKSKEVPGGPQEIPRRSPGAQEKSREAQGSPGARKIYRNK